MDENESKPNSVTVGNISGVSGGQINIAGRDVNTTYTDERNADPIVKAFASLNEQVQKIPAGFNQDMAKNAVGELESEAKKGDKADEKKVGDVFNFLAQIAPDVFEVALATFINPIQGLSVVFQKVAARAKSEKAGT